MYLILIHLTEHSPQSPVSEPSAAPAPHPYRASRRTESGRTHRSPSLPPYQPAQPRYCNHAPPTSDSAPAAIPSYPASPPPAACCATKPHHRTPPASRPPPAEPSASPVSARPTASPAKPHRSSHHAHSSQTPHAPKRSSRAYETCQ